MTEPTLRPHPYPYRAALAICSDLDDTGTLERYLAIQEFLNCEEETPLGPGLGLEVGNTFFPYTPDDSFAYYSSRPWEAEILEELMRAGYVDCIHSFGDGVRDRALALAALERLESRGCRLTVWVDHARAPSNLGKDVTAGEGDVPGSPVYHADATWAYGVRFVWRGRASSIVGQGVPLRSRNLLRVLDPAQPKATGLNLAKDVAKIVLARLGNRRFSLHGTNCLTRVTELADGQRVIEFKRCNSHWRGLSYGLDAEGLAYVLGPRALGHLIQSAGTMIVYTHIGRGPAQGPCLPAATVHALQGVAVAYRSGALYVTTTSRLLAYHVNRQYLRWSHEQREGETIIRVHGVDDPLEGLRIPREDELQGLTFYVPDARATRVYIRERELAHVDRNPADHTGRESVGIPRTYLRYPLPVGVAAKVRA
ncbi:MAG: hypothetical protein ACOYEW_15980 [Anaerolineae bacterium]